MPSSVAVPHAIVELGGPGEEHHQFAADTNGAFAFAKLGPGDYLLRVSGQGFQTIESTIHLDDAEKKELRVTLVAEGPRRVDVVTVQATSDSSGSGEEGQFTLNRQEVQNLATVIGDDPLRAVQAMPGVTSNDDFEARFSLRGADFSRIGVYLDGVLLHNPIHRLEGTDLSGSAGIFNTSLVGQISLYGGVYEEQFADSSAAALEVSMRDGSRDKYHFRMNANLSGAGVAMEGPVNGRCSWIGAFRKTYIQYLLAQALTDPSMAFGLQDGQGRLNCQVTQASTLTLDLIDSSTGLNRTGIRNQLGANSLLLVDQRAQVANLGWTYAPNDKLVLTNHLAWMSDSFGEQNASLAPMGRGSYGEWSENAKLLWMWNGHDALQAGVTVRSKHGAGFTEEYNRVENFQLVDQYAGKDLLTGGYLNQSWTNWKGRVHFNASGRWDHDSLDGMTAFSPQAGISLGLTHSLKLSVGWAEYAQFPDVAQLGSDLGGPRLSPMRSTHGTAGVEYSFGNNTRLRFEVYKRWDRSLLYQPFLDPRMINGIMFLPPRDPLYENSLAGYSRGFDVYVQRTLTKHMSGWASYAYGHARMSDSVTGNSFPSDWDQRHTINTYLSYALRPSLNLSARWSYGSGFPVPGFLTMANGNFYLTNQRNTFRLAPYARLDFRVNKTWTHETWKTTLFAEVLNATNRTNCRFGSLDGYSTNTGLAYVSVDQMFPVLPSVGIVWER